MMQEVFSKKHLMEALKRAGLTWSYSSILRFERGGMIERPKSELGNNEYNGNRLYSQQEIEEIVARVAAHQKGKNSNSTE